jgi:hypothetical protein
VKYGTEEHKNFPAEPGQVWCDFSPPKERAAEFVAVGSVVLDHHSRDVVEPYGELGVFGENEKLECGAWLAYEHVWLPLVCNREPENIPPQIYQIYRDAVRNFAYLAAVRDTWKKDDPRWQKACEQAEEIMFWGEEEIDLRNFLSATHGGFALGEVLVKKKLELARTAISESYRFTSARGTSVLVFQGVSATSEAAEMTEISWTDEKGNNHIAPDLVVGFHYRVDAGKLQLQFSTRSHTGFDCQALARSRGGNGHRAAAGFTVEGAGRLSNPYEVFSELLNDWEGRR